MEFNEKLQELRRKKGLTQEELAAVLFVSRTAVSKWESGRGYPNIDSLKAIARFFSVTVDELLSGDELLTIAEEDTREKETHYRDLVFALLDVSAVILFFLPFFRQQTEGAIQAVSLLSLTGISLWLKIAYAALIAGSLLWGILMLALQNCSHPIWAQHKGKLSILLNAASALLCIVSLQPYAAALLFVFLTIKAFMLIKKP